MPDPIPFRTTTDATMREDLQASLLLSLSQRVTVLTDIIKLQSERIDLLTEGVSILREAVALITDLLEVRRGH